MNRLYADLLLVVAALIWGTAYYFQKTAMDDVGPLLFLGLRSLVACVALLPLAIFSWRRERKSTSKFARLGCFAGIAFFVAAATQQIGIVTASVTHAGILTALYVVATPFVTWLVYKTLPDKAVWAGLVLACIGIWILGGGAPQGLKAGDWLVASSAILWAVHLLISAAGASQGHPVQFSCLQFGVCALISLTLAAVLEPISGAAILRAADDIVFVGLFSTALTFTILNLALKYTGPTEAAIILGLDAVFAALVGYLLLGERLTMMGWIGASLMFAAVVVTQLRSAKTQP